MVGRAVGFSTLIISGKPGAGKTLLVSNLLNKLKHNQWSWSPFTKLTDFKPEEYGDKKIEILQLNAMKFGSCFPFLLDTLEMILNLAG